MNYELYLMGGLAAKYEADIYFSVANFGPPYEITLALTTISDHTSHQTQP